MIVKKYIVFTGMSYYPSGGMGDFRGDYDSISECKDIINSNEKERLCDWWQIVDHKTMKIVEED